MWDIFETVLCLSAVGAAASALLLLIKPFTVKHLPARWQYYIWLTVAVCMIVPFWKFVPKHRVEQIAQRVNFPQTVQITQSVHTAHMTPEIPTKSPPQPQPDQPVQQKQRIDFRVILPCIWLSGTTIFLTLALCSYAVFIFRRRSGSIAMNENTLLDEVKRELKIKRRIRTRISQDTRSPMLVGVLFPVIYIPMKDMEENALRMVFRHELTHYKHGDLLFKWLTLLINAVHWFNPFAYALSANVNQACEVACDMTVVKGLDSSGKKFYMRTILDMIGKG